MCNLLVSKRDGGCIILVLTFYCELHCQMLIMSRLLTPGLGVACGVYMMGRQSEEYVCTYIHGYSTHSTWHYASYS